MKFKSWRYLKPKILVKQDYLRCNISKLTSMKRILASKNNSNLQLSVK